MQDVNVLLRLPKDLKTQVDELARRERRSSTQQYVVLIERALGDVRPCVVEDEAADAAEMTGDRNGK